MKEKLTLSINQKAIKKSKRYAKLHGTSVSSLVETYLDSLTDETETWRPKSGSIVEKLSGTITLPDSFNDYDEVLEQALFEKYGLQKDSD